jgi:hypothetical protein
MSAVIGSGTNVGVGTVHVNNLHTTILKIRATSTTDAVVKVNGNSVTLRGTPTGQTPTPYEEFIVDAPTFDVVSGNVDWYAIG